jgi:hypothetical protein
MPTIVLQRRLTGRKRQRRDCSALAGNGRLSIRSARYHQHTSVFVCELSARPFHVLSQCTHLPFQSYCSLPDHLVVHARHLQKNKSMGTLLRQCWVIYLWAGVTILRAPLTTVEVRSIKALITTCIVSMPQGAHDLCTKGQRLSLLRSPRRTAAPAT